MKHLASLMFVALAACGTMPLETTSPAQAPAAVQQQSPQEAAPVAPPQAPAVPVPWQGWPSDGTVNCHFEDPNIVSADLSVVIDGDTHTGTLTVHDVATGLSGTNSASYVPMAVPTSDALVTGVSVFWPIHTGDAQPHNLGWGAGLDVTAMRMDLVCGGEYAAMHNLCRFAAGNVLSASCSYTPAR